MATHSNVKDDGVFFEVVPNTRKITVPPTHRVLGSVGDHLSEQVTIKCPKIIDGHAVESCTRKFVTWQNVDGQIGHDNVIKVNLDDKYMGLKWSIRNGLTTKKGLVSFSLHFEDVDTNGKTTYRWGTSCCTEGEILDSINGALGVYKSIHVVGDTLVIEDYAPVQGTTLSLDSAALVPSGVKEIDKDGQYDVKEFAEVKVQVTKQLDAPSITVTEGKAVATANGLSATKDLDAPSITIADGKAVATANGLSATKDLDAPTIAVGAGVVTATANGLSATEELDTPTIVMGEGKIIATANGLSATEDLDTPTIEVKDGEVKVAVNGKTYTEGLDAPTITVGEGAITASANGASTTHKPSSAEVANLLPLVTGKIRHLFVLARTRVIYTEYDRTTQQLHVVEKYVGGGEVVEFTTLKGSLIIQDPNFEGCSTIVFGPAPEDSPRPETHGVIQFNTTDDEKEWFGGAYLAALVTEDQFEVVVF